MSIEEKLKKLPENPGVYIMKDGAGNIIYIGKAISLKNRVRQYFNNSPKDAKVSAMVGRVADFDYFIVGSEKEALFLECNLIKKHRPYYNILLKDDKRYPYVRIDMREDYPRVEVVHQMKEDGARYFGPYLSAVATREVIDTLSRNFPLRQCKKDMKKAIERRERPCLNYQIGRCLAPCTGKVSREEYARLIDSVVLFLSGKYARLKSELTNEMSECAQRLEFEKCAALRDRIAAIDVMMQRQAVETASTGDADVFALACDEGDAVLQAVYMRRGKLDVTDKFDITYGGESEAEILTHALTTFYMDAAVVPKTICVPCEPADKEILEQLLSEKRGSRVTVKVPQRGRLRQVLELAKNNAAEALNKSLVKKQREYERTIGACKRLADAIGAFVEIHRMECYDISNTQGTDSVGSMAVFTDGKPDNKEYRKFKIKTVEGADDFASMNEVLTRRFLRALNGDAKFAKLPDLVIIDGGKGQLKSACEALDSLGFHDLPIISLAKREEEVFLPGESQSVILPRDSEELKLLQRIRDEAHRFAITYHRGIRQKRTVITELEKISGVGKVRRRALLRAFDSFDELKNADIETLKAIEGMDERAARAVYGYFHNG